MRRVCVLGCGGFIGSHLTERLVSGDGRKVLGIDRSSRKIAHLLGRPGFEYREVDLGGGADLPGLIEGAEAVVHLASLCNPSLYNTRPLEVIETNFSHALPVVRACAEAGVRLIYFSSCEVYGKTLAGFAPEGSAFAADPRHHVLSEGSTPLILGPVAKERWSYSCAKQMLERVIHAEGRKGLAYTIVRPFNVIGPRMDFIPGVDGEGTPRVVPCFMRALLFGESLKLVEGGHSRRTFVSVRDVVEAVVRILERPGQSRGEIFNVGNPANETTIADLAGLMMEIFAGLTGRPVRSSAVEVSAGEFYGEGYDDCDRRVPDVSKAERLLEWRPATPLRELLEETVEWYAKEYADARP